MEEGVGGGGRGRGWRSRYNAQYLYVIPAIILTSCHASLDGREGA